MPIAAKKLPSSTLRHRIVHEVRQAILNGSLRPGERIVERDLASRLGTSLTSAREALIQLETEGLITKRTNSTTHVIQLTPREIGQIFAVRRVLEEFAFVEAARQCTNEEITKLEKIHADALKRAMSGKAREYIELDLLWHETVWQLADNRYLYDSLKRAILPLFGFSLIGAATSGDFDLVKDARDHKPLLEALASHNPATVRKVYRAASETWSLSMKKDLERVKE